MAPAPTAFERVAYAFVRSRNSPRTREAYTRALKLWLELCAEKGINQTKPSTEEITMYRDSLKEKFKSASVVQHLSALSAIYNFAREQENPVVKRNPFNSRAIPRPKTSNIGKTRSVPDNVAQAMIEAALASPRGLRDAALMSVLYTTGIRRISVVTLLRENAYRRDDGVLVARVIIKGGREVEIEIPSPAAELLEQWLSVAPKSLFVFPMRGGKRHIAFCIANHIVTKWAKAVNVPWVHPHCFRAAFVTGLYDAGAYERDIQAAVHHEDPRSTQRYDRGRRGSGATALLAQHRKDKENK